MDKESRANQLRNLMWHLGVQASASFGVKGILAGIVTLAKVAEEYVDVEDEWLCSDCRKAKGDPDVD